MSLILATFVCGSIAIAFFIWFFTHGTQKSKIEDFNLIECDKGSVAEKPYELKSAQEYYLKVISEVKGILMGGEGFIEHYKVSDKGIVEHIAILARNTGFAIHEELRQSFPVDIMRNEYAYLARNACVDGIKNAILKYNDPDFQQLYGCNCSVYVEVPKHINPDIMVSCVVDTMAALGWVAHSGKKTMPVLATDDMPDCELTFEFWLKDELIVEVLKETDVD